MKKPSKQDITLFFKKEQERFLKCGVAERLNYFLGVVAVVIAIPTFVVGIISMMLDSVTILFSTMAFFAVIVTMWKRTTATMISTQGFFTCAVIWLAGVIAGVVGMLVNEVSLDTAVGTTMLYVWAIFLVVSLLVTLMNMPDSIGSKSDAIEE